MLGTLARFTRQVRRPALAAVAISALVLPTLSVASYARGPEGVADIAEQVIEAVVNISTSQNVASRNNTPMPQLPNDPQLDELFRDFFKPARAAGRRESAIAAAAAAGAAPRQFARLRFHHRRVRHRGDQQPRHR